MDNSKIKNLIIIVLLIVNIFLAGAIGADRAMSNSLKKDALSGVIALLEAKGIAVSQDANLSDTALSVCAVTRDFRKEKKRVSAVLDGADVQDQGGNIMYYQGKNGQAVFRGTGSFEILMNEGAVPTGSDPEATARAFLKKLGISAIKGSSGEGMDVADGSGTVVLGCSKGKTEIINCRVTFTFANGSLMLVSGTRSLDESSSDTMQNELALSTILMRFLDIINESGRVCSELKNAELCYVQTIYPVSGTGTLTPVWRLTTDAGEYYIDGLTGKLETGT